ncbi:hypothetical protein CEXT_687631 [Caerostris extrusa]|uniref:Uncharacterized protein n=1 Tax=Caerostris extrusa TaxID=172846 RepID=A0AAV4TX76_CAEEX|nr:hypothetical protein CEXT_687631 [Caerostris extrusa]
MQIVACKSNVISVDKLFSAVTSLSKHKRFCEGAPSSSSSTSNIPNSSQASTTTTGPTGYDSSKTVPMS